MNADYDWASRLGNRLLLTYAEHHARSTQRRLDREVKKAQVSGLGPAFHGPSINVLTHLRDVAVRRAVMHRAAYADWLARRPAKG